MRLILICSCGISSGYFARKVERAMNETLLMDTKCEAMGYLTFLKRDVTSDFVAIGPVGEENVSRVISKCLDERIPYMLIGLQNYVSMNVNSILDGVIRLKNECRERSDANE